MTHMVCGYPNILESEEIFKTLSKYSEYLEVQFPFSDPIADGPVIEQANKIALENGITTEKCFDFLSSFWIKGSTLEVWKGDGLFKNPKILIMTYYNIVLNYWVENFVKKAKSIWIYGLIIPDVPFDEEDWENFRKICEKYDLVFTEIVSPITTKKRLEQIKELNPELIYAISQNMTTWSKAEFWEEFEKYIKNLNSIFKNSPPYKGGARGGPKIWVWFWVKTIQDIEKICKLTDFAIIWSEFIKKYNNWWISELEKYLEEITK